MLKFPHSINTRTFVNKRFNIGPINVIFWQTKLKHDFSMKKIINGLSLMLQNSQNNIYLIQFRSYFRLLS